MCKIEGKSEQQYKIKMLGVQKEKPIIREIDICSLKSWLRVNIFLPYWLLVQCSRKDNAPLGMLTSTLECHYNSFKVYVAFVNYAMLLDTKEN